MAFGTSKQGEGLAADGTGGSGGGGGGGSGGEGGGDREDGGEGGGGSDGDSAGEPAGAPHALEQPLAPVQTESHVAAQISFIPLVRV